MKCLLVGAIAPPLSNSISPGCLPFGVMALSAFLQQESIHCKVISTALPNADREILNEIKSADLLGISSMSGPYLNYAISVANNIKRVRPNLPIVWGGVHASLMGEDLIINNLADYVIRGVGEKSLLGLIRSIEGKETFSSVPGLIWKEQGEMRLNNPDASFDINDFPQLDYSLVSERYPFILSDEFPYFSSRGCPFDCSFCVSSLLYNRRWYSKSEDKIVDELKEAYERFKFKAVFFWDDNLFVDIERLNNILSRLGHVGINFQWSSFCRADRFARFTDQHISQFKKQGLRWVSIGAESGSQETLEKLDKGIKVDDIRQTAIKLKKWNISCDFSFMAGIPGERVEDFYKTLKLVRWIKNLFPSASVRIFKFVPYPKMPILNREKELMENLPKDTYGWSRITYQTANFSWVPRKIHSALAILSTASFYSEKPKKLSFKNIIIAIFYYINQLRFKINFFFFPLESFVIGNLYNHLSLKLLKNFDCKLKLENRHHGEKY